MKKIHELNHSILQNEELITLKNAYDRAKNIQDSMIELEQYEEKIIKLGKEFRNEGSNVMCRINELTFQHKQAIEAQGKGIVASINGILRSKGLEIG